MQLCNAPPSPQPSTEGLQCKSTKSSKLGPIGVPPIVVTLRMRWFSLSATNTLPLTSTATPVGLKKPALDPDPSANAPLVPLTPPASVETTVPLTNKHRHSIPKPQPAAHQGTLSSKSSFIKRSTQEKRKNKKNKTNKQHQRRENGKKTGANERTSRTKHNGRTMEEKEN
jgi:hypothetical protein